MSMKPAKPKVFSSYSHKDKDLWDELEKYLSILKRHGVITGWHDRRIGVGREWEGEIDRHLNTADVILPLISADFLASDYCYDVEMKRAMERHKAGEARVIPVILRPVDWKGAPFGKLQALPTNAVPVTEWPNRDKAFLNVAQGIRMAVKELMATLRPKSARRNKVGRYETTEVLGRGAMSVVYKAHDPNIDRWVALKIMHFGWGVQSEKLKRRFKREAISAGRLKHPNIVAVHDADEYRGEPFIVTEYLEGPTLAQVIETESPLALKRVISIVDQIGDALDYAHRNGVVHRDIKPSNIFLLENDQVKVADLGLAKLTAASDLTPTGEILGTLIYASPEQLQGQDIDGRTDIFSLGIVIYEMLTGKRPFEKEDVHFIVSQILDERPLTFAALDSELLPGVKEVLLKATAKDVNERYQTCTELAQDLKKCLTPTGAGNLSQAWIPEIL